MNDTEESREYLIEIVTEILTSVNSKLRLNKRELDILAKKIFEALVEIAEKRIN